MGFTVSDETLRVTVEAFNKHGSINATAKALGVKWSTVKNRLIRASERGLDGSVPRPVPLGQRIKGVSTLYDRNGSVMAQWVKTDRDGEARADLLDAITEAMAAHRGAALVPAPPPAPATDLLTIYPIVDHHLGMLAWGRETGGPDYDLEIATGLLRGSLATLLAQAPASETAVILGMGDFTHADDETAATRRSGNRLDVDTRHVKVTRAAVDVLIWCIRAALGKHRRVIVRLLPGNHDPETARMLSTCLALYFEGAVEGRVEIDTDPGFWWRLRWGVNLIAATHGHNVKPLDLPGQMAAKWPDLWGATAVRRFFFGHIHHSTVGERHGCRVESLATLAAPDAYHAEHGYSTAERSMVAITFHRTRGEHSRQYANVLPARAKSEGDS